MPRWITGRLNFTLAVGLVASIMDWLSLVFFVKALNFTPQMANAPSLIVGSAVQFFGNRYFVFKATSQEIGRQATEFILVEALAFLLNGFLFYVFVTWTPIHYTLARPLASFAVFLCFSYPLWKFVFRNSGQEKKN